MSFAMTVLMMAAQPQLPASNQSRTQSESDTMKIAQLTCFSVLIISGPVNRS